MWSAVVHRVVLLLTVCLSSCVCAGDPVTLGGVELAYSLVAFDNLFVDDLKLTDSEKRELAALFEEWMQSDLRRQIELLKADSATNANQRFNDFESHYDFIKPFNEKVLSDIDAVLDSASRERRFRQLLSQAFARFGHYESFVRLNGETLDSDEYSKLREAFQKVSRTELEKRVAIQCASHLLVSSKYVDQVVLEQNLGAIFEFQGQKNIAPLDVQQPNVPDLRISKYARDDFSQLLRRNEVQVELKLTPKVASEGAKLAIEYRLSPALVSDFVSDPKLTSSKAQSWMKELEARVDSLLTKNQAKRLRQLLLQLYLREGEFEWTLRSITKDPIAPSISNELALLQNDWQAMVYFKHEARKLLLARSVLETSFGETKTSGYLGKLAIATRTPWEDESNKKRHTELRRFVLRDFAKKQRVKNARRNQSFE